MSLESAVNPHELRVLLCDADDNLFPSEEPAFVASATITNALLASMGIDVCYEAEELRTATAGKNFRATAVNLCIRHGVGLSPELAAQRKTPSGTPDRLGRPVLTTDILDHWVEAEKSAVTEQLSRELRPDPGVTTALRALAPLLTLAAVSSSASTRLAACFEATGLATFFPPDRTFSAEDSLPVPTSKPDPAIYRVAGERLGCDGVQALAVEDSVAGAQSAVVAGFATVANLEFVPPAERLKRRALMRDAGVVAVVESWAELTQLLLPLLGRRPPSAAPQRSLDARRASRAAAAR